MCLRRKTLTESTKHQTYWRGRHRKERLPDTERSLTAVPKTLFRPLNRRQQGSHACALQRAGGLQEHRGVRSDVKGRDKYNKNTSSARPNGPDGQAGTREAQAKSEVLLSANAHTQLNPRHGRDQHSEAACAASSNIAQLNKKSNPHSALSFSREVSPSAKREYRKLHWVDSVNHTTEY